MRFLRREGGIRSAPARGAWPLALALLLAMGAPAVAAQPDFPAPPKATIGRMGKNMVYNGVPMDVRQFRSRASVDEVLDFYRREWPAGTRDRPGYVENDSLPPWKMITRVEDGWLMTVQVTAEDGGSSGYLAMSRMPDPDDLPELGEGFPTLRGSTVYQDIRSEDVGKQGRTIQLFNDHSGNSNVIFYRNWYLDRGWKQLMDRDFGARIHTLAYTKGDRTVNLVITQSKGGAAVVTAQIVDRTW